VENVSDQIIDAINYAKCYGMAPREIYLGCVKTRAFVTELDGIHMVQCVSPYGGKSDGEFHGLPIWFQQKMPGITIACDTA
jgi:hypothetical protein